MGIHRLEINVLNDRKISIEIDEESGVVSVSGARLVQDVGMNKTHVNPFGTGKTVSGRRLRPGEVLQKGDLFNAENGNWEPISAKIVGIAIEKSSPSIFIRPGA